MRSNLRLVLFVTAIVAATSARAQRVDVFLHGTTGFPEGSSKVRNGAAKVELARGTGIEAGANLHFGGRLSTELAVGSARHDLDAAAFGENVDLGATRLTQFSLMLQLHSNSAGTVDFHIGAGPAFVHLRDITNTSELQLLGIREIRFHDRFVPVAGAGLDLRLTRRWALTLDAKYFDIHSRTTATYFDGSETAGLDLKQLNIGAGAVWRF